MITKQANTSRELIENAILELAPTVALDSNTSLDEVKTFIRVFMRSHPEIFWFSHQYMYDEELGILKFRYNFTKEKTYFFKGEIEKVIKDDFHIDYVKTLSEMERLVYTYKWIARRTTYNAYSSFNQTIYSVLINRNSVCTGYAKTAQYLLSLVGIHSELVFGKFHADKSEHGHHAWNLVQVKEKWFHIDFCLADISLGYLLNFDETPIEKESILWNYFGVSTDFILHNRSIEIMETLPVSEDRIAAIPNVEVLKPQKPLICCKSDSGTFAKVFLDSFNKAGVVKVSRSENLELLQNEARILHKLSGSPHIIKSYGLDRFGLKLEQLTPWSELLNSHYYNPTEFELNDILQQLMEGLIECRNKGITYSDIHYNNVFVAKNGTYKWGDFGIAFSAQPEGTLPPIVIANNGKPKGSYWFMSPETFHYKKFTEASAIYSVAMMAYFVMNNMRPPFWTNGQSQEESLYPRLNGEELDDPAFICRYKNLWPILKNALSFSWIKRPSSYEDFLQQLKFSVASPTATEENIISLDFSADDDFAFTVNDATDADFDVSIEDYDYDTTSVFCASMAVSASYNGNISIDELFATLDLDGANPEDFGFTKSSDTFASTIGSKQGDGGIQDSDSYACSCGGGEWSAAESVKDDFAISAPLDYNDIKRSSSIEIEATAPGSSRPSPIQSLPRESYGVYNSTLKEKRSIWSKLFGKKEKSELINASAYAPAEIKPYKNFIVRIFLHKPEESNSIDMSVKDVDKSAVKKANKPLDIPVKENDRISVQLSLTDGTIIDEPLQNVVWRGRYIECDFICKLTDDDLSSIWGKAVIGVNSVPCGHLKFELDVVRNEPRKVYAKAEVKRFSKIFISYAHADYHQVRGIAEGCKMNGSDYFFDRHTLKAGDIFKDKILQYIDNADLFVLCWSKNAAESEWVQIERKYALELIEKGNHQLAIYPLSMPPEAPLPEDMSDKYNFASL